MSPTARKRGASFLDTRKPATKTLSSALATLLPSSPVSLNTAPPERTSTTTAGVSHQSSGRTASSRKALEVTPCCLSQRPKSGLAERGSAIESGSEDSPIRIAFTKYLTPVHFRISLRVGTRSTVNLPARMSLTRKGMLGREAKAPLNPQTVMPPQKSARVRSPSSLPSMRVSTSPAKSLPSDSGESISVRIWYTTVAFSPESAFWSGAPSSFEVAFAFARI